MTARQAKASKLRKAIARWEARQSLRIALSAVMRLVYSWPLFEGLDDDCDLVSLSVA
jgi:hypothetical protein